LVFMVLFEHMYVVTIDKLGNNAFIIISKKSHFCNKMLITNGRMHFCFI